MALLGVESKYAYASEQYEGETSPPSVRDRAPSVLIGLERLEKRLHVIAELSGSVQERCERVMLPDTTGAEGPGQGANQAPMACPMAHQLEMLNTLADNTERRLRDVLRRLEI